MIPTSHGLYKFNLSLIMYKILVRVGHSFILLESVESLSGFRDINVAAFILCSYSVDMHSLACQKEM